MKIREPIRVSGPSNIAPFLIKKIGRKTKEHVVVITLDASHNVISYNVVTIGLVNRSLLHPREVFRQAIIDNACAIMWAHNHPSGNLEFSEEDLSSHKRLKEAGEIVGIKVLDALVITKTKYSSAMENQI